MTLILSMDQASKLIMEQGYPQLASRWPIKFIGVLGDYDNGYRYQFEVTEEELTRTLMLL